MFFASDNWAGAHPKIAESLAYAASRSSAPYGNDAIDKEVEQRFCALFEREVAVFYVATGTAANSLGLAAVKRTGGVIFCHSDAHIIHHEGLGVEFATGGAKLKGVSGAGREAGKICPENLVKAMAKFPNGDVHVGERMALSISQMTESGTIYTRDEIRALSDIAKSAGMAMHMDGARFANAMAALNVTPAEMTWKSGVDILSLGGTKNGCWCAEAIIFMNPSDARDLPALRKRGGHLFSKNIFVSTQFGAWLKHDLWLDLARHANAMADDLRAVLTADRRTRLAWNTTANQIFAIISDETAKALRSAGSEFYPWERPDDLDVTMEAGEGLFRFVTSYATTAQDIEKFTKTLSIT